MTIMMSRTALENYGLVNLGTIHWNLSPAVLVEHALARKEAVLASNGALAATTGVHTGRSPKDKFIVSNQGLGPRIWWGDNNHPMSQENFEAVRSSLSAYLQGRDVYVLDAAAAADPHYRMSIQVITELAWHNLFARQLFLRANENDLASPRPGFTILCVPNFHTDPRIHGTRSEAAIIIDFEERLVLIAGTRYAGEMKKSIFTVLNFILPAEDVLPMHCSANEGPGGDVASSLVSLAQAKPPFRLIPAVASSVMMNMAGGTGVSSTLKVAAMPNVLTSPKSMSRKSGMLCASGRSTKTSFLKKAHVNQTTTMTH